MQLVCGTPLCVLSAGHAIFRHHHELARKNIANVLGAQQIEGACLAGEDDSVGTIGMPEATHRKRAEAARIASSENAVARHHDDRERAIHLREGIGYRIDQRSGAGECAIN